MSQRAVLPFVGRLWTSWAATVPFGALELAPLVAGAALPLASGRPLVLGVALGESLPQGLPVVEMAMMLPWLPAVDPVVFVATVGASPLGFLLVLEG